MKNEMPPRRTIAPIAIAIASPPLSPLLLEEPDVAVMIVGVVVVGVLTDGWGRPGARGLDGPDWLIDPPPWARAEPGRASARMVGAAIRNARTRTPVNLSEGLLHRGRLGGVDVRLLLLDVLLVVDALGVDGPDVVA